MTQYLLDANVFIQAKNLQYGMDFCPAFWDWMEHKNGSKSVFSIEAVGTELTAQEDDLALWAEQRGQGFFLPPDAEMVKVLPALSTWANGQNYRPAAISTFLQSADYYLVAFALAHGYTVVTHERISDAVKAVKIPKACIGVRVKCMTPYEMLRKERARFVLGK